MTDTFRSEFKELIENTHIPANSSQEYVRETWDNILKPVVSNMPKSLYRFRPMNEYSLTSLQNGTITVCHPSVFPDKYDSLVYVNTDNKYLFEEFHKILPHFGRYGIKISSDEIYSVIDYIQKKTNAHMEYLRNNPFIRIACLTERVDSKFMWDNYGGGYKGFALEYDTMRLFVRAGLSEYPINIFPVIYSNERLDSTNDAMYAAAWDIVPQNNPLALAMMTTKCPGPDQLYWYRSYLYKSEEDYSREREWRLMHAKKDSTIKTDYLDIPDYDSVVGIYYGPDISSQNRMRLHAIATKRGIAEYDVVVSNSPSYSLEVMERVKE